MIKDKALIEFMRTLNCSCRSKKCIGQIVGHHIYSRGSGGPDLIDNLLPLCVYHHAQVHNIGLESFIDKNNLRFIMLSKNWEYSDNTGWINYELKRIIHTK